MYLILSFHPERKNEFQELLTVINNTSREVPIVDDNNENNIPNAGAGASPAGGEEKPQQPVPGPTISLLEEQNERRGTKRNKPVDITNQEKETKKQSMDNE
jgi:hypothetical protein